MNTNQTLLRVMRSFWLVPLFFILGFLFGGPLFATTWQAGENNEGTLNPPALFVVVYNTGTVNPTFSFFSRIQLLCNAPPCTDGRSFRMPRSEGKYITPMDDKGELLGTYEQVDYSIKAETRDMQEIEVSYAGDMVLQSRFRYQVRGERIIPQSSWVLSPFHLPFAAIVFGGVALFTVLSTRLIQWWHRRV